jgi:hypothetical protein
MIDCVFRKNDIALVKEVDVSIFAYASIYVKTHEGGRSGDQNDEGVIM